MGVRARGARARARSSCGACARRTSCRSCACASGARCTASSRQRGSTELRHRPDDAEASQRPKAPAAEGRAKPPQRGAGGAASKGAPRRRRTVEVDNDALHLALLGRAALAHRQWNPEHRVYLGARQTRFMHPSVVGAGEEAAGVGDGVRAGRDHAAVRAHGRQDRARVARSGRSTTCSSAATPTRTGRRSRRAPRCASTRRCSACRC